MNLRTGHWLRSWYKDSLALQRYLSSTMRKLSYCSISLLATSRSGLSILRILVVDLRRGNHLRHTWQQGLRSVHGRFSSCRPGVHCDGG